MANAYLLNGTVSLIHVSVNTGTDIPLDALDIQTPTIKSTAKLGLAGSPVRTSSVLDPTRWW